MKPRIENMPVKTFVGKRLPMSFAANKTGELWRSFMPRRKEVSNTIGTELYSMEVYPSGFFRAFNPATLFDKWAAVQVSNSDTTPDGMELLVVSAGLYAVFVHYGPTVNGPETYRRIFTEWLPEAGYAVDERPHFAIMGEKYKPESEESEEEIWIPVKPINP